MNRYLLFLLTILSSLSLHAQDASAIVKWDHKTIDLGEVGHDELVNNVFSFTNISEAPVEIDIVSTCDCTEAKWTLGEIEPGEKGTIKFIFDVSQKDKEEPIDVDVYFMNQAPDGTPYSSFLSYTFTFKQ